ncbi:AAA family ATPase [Bdellovibrionota bacterium FG-1]
MTLEKYFVLTSSPFPKNPLEEAILRHSGLEETLVRLRSAISRDTIALLAAESGCGKSTVLSLLSRSLDPASYHVLAMSMTTLGPFGFLAYLAAATGLRSGRFKGNASATLLAHFRGLSKRTVVIIDEAHLLPDASLEDLRLLTADELDQSTPFSLILAGQPLLRERIGEPQHYALWQRIGVRQRLRPLNEGEVALFIDRQLRAAGCKKNPFDPEAIAIIFQHSRGIPRLIQNLAIDAMIAAMTAGKKIVDANCVQQAVVDMEAT